MVFVSKEFIHAVRTSPIRNYRLALNSGVHPTYLSKLINHAVTVKNGDHKVIAIGKVLGIDSDNCFKDIA